MLRPHHSFCGKDRITEAPFTPRWICTVAIIEKHTAWHTRLLAHWHTSYYREAHLHTAWHTCLLCTIHLCQLCTITVHCAQDHKGAIFIFFILYFHMLADGQLYTVAILVHNISTQLIVMMMCSLRVCLNSKGWWSHIVMHCTLYRSKYDLTQLKLHLLLCSQLHEDSKVEGKNWK